MNQTVVTASGVPDCGGQRPHGPVLYPAVPLARGVRLCLVGLLAAWVRLGPGVAPSFLDVFSLFFPAFLFPVNPLDTEFYYTDAIFPHALSLRIRAWGFSLRATPAAAAAERQMAFSTAR